MNSVFGIFRTACVWVLLPLTFVSGLPQMHCRCAEAQGRRFCECCYASTTLPKDDEALPPCCQNHQAAPKHGGKNEASACPTCGRVPTTRSGGCCYWRDGAARVVANHVDVKNLAATVVALPWALPAELEPTVVEPVIAFDLGDPLPPPDRVILFRHLLI